MTSQDPSSPPKRTRRLFVRLTDQERATLDQEARAAGMDVSDFVRSRVLRTRGPSARSAMTRAASPAFVAMSPPLFAELSRLGNNLNQLARAFNRGQDIDRGHVIRLVARAWEIMLTDEVTARYATTAEAKARPR